MGFEEYLAQPQGKWITTKGTPYRAWQTIQNTSALKTSIISINIESFTRGSVDAYRLIYYWRKVVILKI